MSHMERVYPWASTITPRKRGEHRGHNPDRARRIIPWETICAIRADHKDGMRIERLAAKYRISRTYCYRIVNDETRVKK